MPRRATYFNPRYSLRAFILVDFWTHRFWLICCNHDRRDTI